MSHTNTWETDGLYRKFTGEINGEEILESNLELHIHPDFINIKYIINDFTEITGYSVDNADTKTFATVDNVISNDKVEIKIALVATQDPHIALANNYCDEMKKNNKWECAVFYTIEDARKWVGNSKSSNLTSR